jgi:hypothetical protein
LPPATDLTVFISPLAALPEAGLRIVAMVTPE